ncbi:MAG: PHP domain-containing protein [Oscillospiraceae bacterium]|nr:PHP domain-containing protein [Oscillospiraceae bacterium]
MILAETHLHTSVSSSCGMVSPANIPALYKKTGYGAIVVTDHYYEKTKEKYNKSADEWLTGYRIVRDTAKKIGIKVFLGMELRLTCAPEDLLIYGFDENFLLRNERIYELTMPKLYELTQAYGLLIYQAHPFRAGLSRCDPSMLDGAEVHNGNPRHQNCNDKAKAFGEKHGLLQISGSDFHRYGDEGRGGIWLDDAIETEKELAQYLRTRPNLAILDNV